jgi:hypothetical protein
MGVLGAWGMRWLTVVLTLILTTYTKLGGFDKVVLEYLTIRVGLALLIAPKLIQLLEFLLWFVMLKAFGLREIIEPELGQ